MALTDAERLLALAVLQLQRMNAVLDEYKKGLQFEPMLYNEDTIRRMEFDNMEIIRQTNKLAGIHV